jgi:phage tail protein X
MAQSETQRIEGDFVTLSSLIWRRFRREMPGMFERVLAANPGLAELGVYLPVGTEVIIPLDPVESAAAPTIRLWS